MADAMLYVVGLGPGDARYLTAQAQTALQAADVLCGYTVYVDGKAVYTATSNIPSTAGKIMMNVWPGIGVNDWLKPFDGKTPLTASYEWVTYQSTAKAN